MDKRFTLVTLTTVRSGGSIGQQWTVVDSKTELVYMPKDEVLYFSGRAEARAFVNGLNRINEIMEL